MADYSPRLLSRTLCYRKRVGWLLFLLCAHLPWKRYPGWDRDPGWYCIYKISDRCCRQNRTASQLRQYCGRSRRYTGNDQELDLRAWENRHCIYPGTVLFKPSDQSHQNTETLFPWHRSRLLSVPLEQLWGTWKQCCSGKYVWNLCGQRNDKIVYQRGLGI